jgi:hypothetical protein
VLDVASSDQKLALMIIRARKNGAIDRDDVSILAAPRMQPMRF